MISIKFHILLYWIFGVMVVSVYALATIRQRFPSVKSCIVVNGFAATIGFRRSVFYNVSAIQ